MSEQLRILFRTDNPSIFYDLKRLIGVSNTSSSMKQEDLKAYIGNIIPYKDFQIDKLNSKRIVFKYHGHILVEERNVIRLAKEISKLIERVFTKQLNEEEQDKPKRLVKKLDFEKTMGIINKGLFYNWEMGEMFVMPVNTGFTTHHLPIPTIFGPFQAENLLLKKPVFKKDEDTNEIKLDYYEYTLVNHDLRGNVLSKEILPEKIGYMLDKTAQYKSYVYTYQYIDEYISASVVINKDEQFETAYMIMNYKGETATIPTQVLRILTM